MAVGVVLAEGDPVLYAAEPLLYGEMEVAHLRKAKHGTMIVAVCRVDPDRCGPAVYELFAMEELEPIPKR